MALIIDGLTASYGLAQILFDVSLHVDPGTLTCIRGPNGAGKTSLLRAIAGTIETPRGRIRLRDRTIDGLSPWDRVRAGIMLVPDDRRIFSTLSVRENLDLSNGLLSCTEKRRRWDLLVGSFTVLPELLGRGGSEISGGQQQIIALCRGILGAKDFLLLDEPTTGLSKPMTDALKQVLESLMTEGLGIMMTTQDLQPYASVKRWDYTISRGHLV